MFRWLVIAIIVTGCAAQPRDLDDRRLGRVPRGDELNRDAILVETKKPHYPSNLASNLVEGFVVVSFRISENGSVIDPEVVFSRPEETFDEYAVNAAKEWRYEPKIVDGRPVASKKRSLITFCVDETHFPKGWVRPKACRSEKGFKETMEILEEHLDD